jgi:PII-like signaling protein
VGQALSPANAFRGSISTKVEHPPGPAAVASARVCDVEVDADAEPGTSESGCRPEVQDTQVVKLARKSPRPEPQLAHDRQQGPAKLMRVFLGESDRWHDEPLHDAIVKRLRMMEIAGATVYRGILGYGAKGHERKRSFFHPMRDLPVMISVIDTSEKIAVAAEAIEGMLQDGLIVLSDVDMVRLVRSHSVTEAPDAARLSS